MSEYQEALSRLNMPERTPGTTISRSQFPISRKDTPWNYDRILRETLNTPLPKYSIPQRLFIPNDGSTSYTFPLDKQFTLAKGGRKAIAIREVNMNNELNIYGDKPYEEHLSISITGDLDYTDLLLPNMPAQVHLNLVYPDVAFPRTFSIEEFYYKISEGICITIDNELNTQLHSVGLDFSVPIHDNTGMRFSIGGNASFNLNQIQNFTVTIGNLNDHQRWSVLGLHGDESKNFEVDYNHNTFYCAFPNAWDGPFSLCSTINPWSPGNIIGSLETFYPNLNKLFPYDNQQEIKLWFIDQKGNHIYNRILSGYIDLELIIDNLNNFAMDD